MNLPDEKYQTLLGSDEAKTGKFEPPLVNIEVGADNTIKELTEGRGRAGERGSMSTPTSSRSPTPNSTRRGCTA